MRTFGARRHARASSAEYISQPQTIALSTQAGPDFCESRYEPETFGAPTVPADPYAAWVQQRAAEQEREEHPEVRWVFRPRAAAGPAIRASAVGDHQPAKRRDDHARPSSARLTPA
jgi:hypothetical protein